MEDSLFALRGQVAVVTGAGRGIGKGIALALANAGARVVLASRTTDELVQVADEVRSLGGESLPVRADVTSAADVQAMIARTLEVFGRVDVLVNNAGVFQRWSEPEAIEDAEWTRVLDTNLRSVFLCCREVGRVMIARGGGAVVNITSIAGGVGVPRMAAYGAAKSGIVGLTRSLAIDWAPRNIRVNAVAPGYIATDANADIRENAEIVREVTSKTPLGRFGTIAEIAAAVQFLASPAATYITGQTLFVDGGWSAW